ncbi:GNAT family N-acetyltransferase [Gemmatimonadota bacterium]
MNKRRTGHELRLQEPRAELGESYRELVREFVEGGEELVPFPLTFPHDDFPEFLDRLSACSRGEKLPPGFVAHSTYWLVHGNTTVVGVSNLRHRLTDALRRYGGHIGYGIRPSARGNGYGTEILRQTLARAEGIGLSQVLLFCGKSNEASARVIRRNGGALESEEFLPEQGKVIQRYWIPLGGPP